MLKMGRKPVRFTGRSRRTMAVMTRHLLTLGPAPAATNPYIAAVKVPWGMMLNDQLGCCVCSDTGHTIMLRTANVGAVEVATANEILKLYEQVGGYVPGDPSTDQGCDELSMAQYLRNTGFVGHKLDNYASVNYKDQDLLVWSVQLFGSCRLGINLPAWAMDAFNRGQPWGKPPTGADTSILGGHDVPLVDFRGGMFKCVTWSKLQVIDQDFINLYCEEAHAELAFDWIQRQGIAPNNLCLEELANDLLNVE